MSHHFQQRSLSSALPSSWRFFPGGLGGGARSLCNKKPKHLGIGSSSGAVVSPSRTTLQQQHRVTAAAQQETAALGWAARDASGVLSPFHFSRRCHTLCFHFIAC